MSTLMNALRKMDDVTGRPALDSWRNTLKHWEVWQELTFSRSEMKLGPPLKYMSSYFYLQLNSNTETLLALSIFNICCRFISMTDGNGVLPRHVYECRENCIHSWELWPRNRVTLDGRGGQLWAEHQETQERWAPGWTPVLTPWSQTQGLSGPQFRQL